ncbi:MAG: hypothetical protein O7B25_01095 [Gammaproteobacteria bacterium]|nr:hypothetical protein [Gammaproteobacteria bacterium]
MTSKIPVADLLAHRDGEQIDPRLSVEIESDPDSRARLKTIRDVKGALIALPGMDPPPEIWQNIDRRRRAARLRHTRTNMAIAATVFMAAALSILWWNVADDGPTEISTAPPSDLLLRSQQLESQAFYRQAPVDESAGQILWRSSARAMLYRIADLDSELNSEYAGPRHGSLERERLWRQRVELLESLVEVQHRQSPSLRTALY